MISSRIAAFVAVLALLASGVAALLSLICAMPGIRRAPRRARGPADLQVAPSESPQSPFVGVLGSRLSLWQDGGSRKLGVDHSSLASQRWGKTSFMEPLLHIGVKDHATDKILFIEGDSLASKATGWHPWGFVQEAQHRFLTLRVTVSYADLDVVNVKAEVVNSGFDERSLSIYFEGRPTEGDSGREVRLEDGVILVRQTSVPTLTGQPSDWFLEKEPNFDIVTGIKPRFRIAGDTFRDAMWGEPGYRAEGEPFSLARGGSKTFSFVASAAGREREARRRITSEGASAPPEGVEATELFVLDRLNRIKGSADRLTSQARDQWDSRLSSMRQPADSTFAHLLHHAAVVLLRNTVRPQPGQGYGRMMDGYYGTFPSRGHYEAFWIWDSAFQAMGFAKLGWLDLAKSNIRLMLHGQDPVTGALTYKYPNSMVPGAQPPVFSLAAMDIYREAKNAEFLAEVYPKLKSWNQWWHNTRLRLITTEQGTFELFGYGDDLESGWDNSPRWDGTAAANLVSPDLNAFMLMDLKMLAQMARILGHEQDAREFDAKAEALGRAMVQALYHAIDCVFYDRDYRSGAFRRVITPASFMPLWAGVPLSEADTEAVIEKNLLNPNICYGPYPFPTVAYRTPGRNAQGYPIYDPGFYWRGPIWLNLAYFMTDVLFRHGYEQEGWQARERILNMVNRHPYIYEYYNAENGLPGTGHDEHNVPAARDFSWSSAFVILMIFNHFNHFNLQ